MFTQKIWPKMVEPCSKHLLDGLLPCVFLGTTLGAHRAPQFSQLYMILLNASCLGGKGEVTRDLI